MEEWQKFGKEGTGNSIKQFSILTSFLHNDIVLCYYPYFDFQLFAVLPPLNLIAFKIFVAFIVFSSVVELKSAITEQQKSVLTGSSLA